MSTLPDSTTPGLGPWRSADPATSGFVPFPDEAVDGTLIARFREVAQRFPTSQAISSPAGSWSYDELLGAVDRRAVGVAALVDDDTPSPVAILAAHDGPLVVTILSVIAAGHIVVVLDPAGTESQLEHALAECDATLVLHDDAHAELARSLVRGTRGRARPATLDEADELGARAEGTTTPSRTVTDPVMLAFTSGTSGTPKAAVITNGVLLNLIRGATNALGIGPDDRMPMLFPTSLAVAAYPMFLPLLNGGTLCTLDVRSVGLAPVADFLAGERITLAYMAPTVIRFLVDALADRTFPDLRMLALGGELVDADVVELTRSLLGPDLLANGYGTTESGVITLYVIDPAEPLDGAVPAGYAVPDVDLYVLDDEGRALPPGEPGEIAVSSRYVFSGYWGHPELNRQVLAEDPQGRPGWQLYRTGDFGHLDERSVLTVAGRIDTKVKVRGRFVVLGDIEAALNGLEEVADCAVTAVTSAGITELVAYVVPAAGSTPDVTELRARLLERESSYNVPGRWVLLDELPRLPNGKTDRRSLPSPDAVQGGVEPGRAISPANTADRARVRDQICALWGRLLPVGTVGPDEDFFHLGGDSLLAAQMLVMAEHETGVTVPMGELVHARTARELAEVICRIRGEGSEGQVVSCVQRGDESSRPRLWFVPDLQGSAYRVRHLAEALGEDQPVWSFESPLLAGEPNRFTSLRSFAAFLLRHLRANQPEGPYWLAGYSFGGICAYEMARQLLDAGEEVAFVGVVDVGPSYRGPGSDDRRSPGRPWFGIAKGPDPSASPSERFRHYREMVRTSPLGALRHLTVRTGVARIVDPWRFRADLARHGRVRPEWRLWYAWEEHWKLAATAWDRTTRLPGRMHLFWESSTGSTDSTMGWGPIVEDLVVHRFEVGPGRDHDDILEPAGAPALAGALRAAMDAERSA